MPVTRTDLACELAVERAMRAVMLDQWHAALVRQAELEQQCAALREELRRYVRGQVAS